MKIEKCDQYKEIVENINVGLIQVDINYIITYVNKKFCDLIGYSSNELIGRDPIEFVQNVYLDIVKKQRKNFSKQVRLKTFELGWKTKTGLNVYTLNSAKLIYSEIQAKKVRIVTLFDITGQKILEKKAKKERIRKQTLQSIGFLAGGLAHEYNNILVGMLGNVQLLEFSENLNDEEQELLQDLYSSTMEAVELTKKLLTFSKGGKPILKSELILNIVEDAARLSLRSPKLNYQCIVESIIPPLNVDSGQIKQVFVNLLLNAKEAMPDGGLIQIIISIIEIKDEKILPLPIGNYLKIAIKDSGVGILEENQDHIFDLFFTTKSKGRGLGLPTSLSIIHNHGGHISFSSQPNVGSTFFVYLPIEEEKIPKSQINIPNLITKKNRILVMDDNKSLHRFLERVFKKFKISMDSAYDGLETIEKYKKSVSSNTPYSLVIMDLTIPGGLGGKETMKELLKIDKNVKVIVSSGYSNDPIMSNYKNYGFINILNKPYTIETLKKIIQKHLS